MQAFLLKTKLIKEVIFYGFGFVFQELKKLTYKIVVLRVGRECCQRSLSFIYW